LGQPIGPIFMGQETQDLFTPEDGTNRLSGNAGKELPLYTAYCPRRVLISCASWQKPEIMQEKNIYLYSEKFTKNEVWQTNDNL